MATFEEHIEGLTQLNITSSSSPSQSELTTFLVNGLIDCANKITNLRPEELSKFSKTTNATDSVAKKGKILSVVREHDSTSILRVCTPIDASLRYEATDVESLHYRSKYNPGYYERDGLIICVPEASGSGNNDIVVTQVHYDTGLINSDEYNAGAVENFPLEYEYLIALYAAAMCCNSAASDIQNNMPVKPNGPSGIQLPSPPIVIQAPNIFVGNVDLPKAPVYNAPAIDFNLDPVLTALSDEDVEMAEKELELVEKKLERFDKEKDISIQNYTNSLDVFNKEMERLDKNADRESQMKVAEYKSIVEKYNTDIINYQQEAGLIIGEYTQDISKFSQNLAKYGAELQEVTTKYQWFKEQHITFLTQYNNGLGASSQPAQPQREEEG
tara:strand:+ start:1248 stop:2402 length:1155 start_codon:yes stop_codon:yes gene_type:complete